MSLNLYRQRFLSTRYPLITIRRHTSSKAQPAERIGIKELVQRDIKHAEQLGVLAPAPPNTNGFRKVIHTAIQLGKFYYRGTKLIYTRGKEVAKIKARIRAGGFPLVRSEARLMHTQRSDIQKLIPFIILALVLEELIPVLALYAPNMLPSTVILPGQRQRINEKRTQKAITSAFESKQILANIRKNAVDGNLPSSALRGTGSATALCSLLRLPTFGIDLLRIGRIHRHLRFIHRDDKLLIQDKLQESLNEHELAQALDERGFIVQNLSLKAQQARLKWWLDSVKDVSDDLAVARRLYLLTEERQL
ncbi:hypothetical protein BT96DRAFT_1018080 [Gymnopus androsaceus JB14]|uniref:Letm1 RBD domain-containing protein n=1 Tax=Gymnopus androsaceus JB14 TaxID=1447944 RepID=A0A6A4HT65_9AGAR|nr:hypothetical protein BT96DRAFT_1018080 [Gymnopus androsaceus JB14]